MAGHGIIYTLTKRDANQVAEWLRSRGIEADAYTGDTGDRREERWSRRCSTTESRHW